MGVIGRAIAIAAAALLCGWALLQWVYVPHRCSVELTALTRRTNTAISTAGDYARTVRARRNLEELAWMREHCPSDVRVPMLAAANEGLLGRHDDAIRSYRAALQVERRPEIYAALAETLVMTGRIAEAVESYTTAMRFGGDLTVVIASPAIQEQVKERLRGGR